MASSKLLTTILAGIIPIQVGSRLHFATTFAEHMDTPEAALFHSSINTACPCNKNHTKPLQVFLLDGQSNMVGMGSLYHLQQLLNDSATHDEYSMFWNESSNDWAVRSDVYVKFGDPFGKLKPGFGAAGPSHGGHIGPELGFGWELGDDRKAASCPCLSGGHPILLLKAAYGGRNLAVDFRPPLSGVGNYSGVKPLQYGWEYRQMIQDIQDTLTNDLVKILPDYYNPDVGYELSGMVWFQGWNDMLSQPMVDEYGYNLANLIRSMRLDLDAPDMPVVIGELGMKGTNPTDRGRERYFAMQAAEQEVANMEEFQDSTIFVPTAQYAILNGTAYNGIYHYYGRADTYIHIGRAFGKAMYSLTTEKEQKDKDMKAQKLKSPGDTESAVRAQRAAPRNHHIRTRTGKNPLASATHQQYYRY